MPLSRRRLPLAPPGTQALHDGDAFGCWMCISSPVWKAALPLSGAAALLHILRGEGLGALEAATYLAFIAGLGTEMWKVVRSVTGEGG